MPQESPSQTATYYELARKNRLVRKLAAASGALALGTALMPFSMNVINSDDAKAAPETHLTRLQSPPLNEVGVFEPLLLSRDLGQSQRVAQMIEEDGFNSVEIRENYVEWEAGNVENDWPAFCNAAQAAQENNLHTYLTIQTYDHTGKPAYMPKTLTEYKKFYTTMATYLNGLSGPSASQNPKGAHRCNGLKTPISEVELNLINEANDKNFVPQDMDADGNYLNPKEVVDLYAFEYPRLKDLAKKLGFKLIITAGALNPTINNLDFANKMGEVIRQEGIKGPIFDRWDAHLYTPGGTPQSVHPNAADIGPSDIPMLSQTLASAFGRQIPIVGGEYGVQPDVPYDKLSLYEGILPNGPTTDEAGQAQQYHDTLAILACTSLVKGIYFFHLIDDYAARQWALSGIRYPDYSPKSSAASIIESVNEAKNGTIANCGNIKKAQAKNARRQADLHKRSHVKPGKKHQP